MEHEIAGCFNCSLCLVGADFTCVHPGTDNALIEVEEETGAPITPDWCPLRKEPLIIKLKL